MQHLVRDCHAEALEVWVTKAAEEGRQVVNQQRNVDSINACRLKSCVMQRRAAAVGNGIPNDPKDLGKPPSKPSDVLFCVHAGCKDSS